MVSTIANTLYMFTAVLVVVLLGQIQIFTLSIYCLKNCESICVKSKVLEDTLNFLMFLKRYLGLEIEIFLTSQLQL